MASYHWAKVHIAVVDDMDYGTLISRAVKCTYLELLLMAKENENYEKGVPAGTLPSLPKLMFRLHMDQKTLEHDLSQLANHHLVKIIYLDDEGLEERWFLPKYAKMQEASAATQRMREYRKRKKEAKKEKELDIDIDIEHPATSNVTGVTKRNDLFA